MALPCSATQLKSMQFLASRILVWIIEILPSRSVHRTISLVQHSSSPTSVVRALVGLRRFLF
jgi:hypothetical protein